VNLWLDGRLCDEAEACVSPFDHGLMTGDGIFETLKVYAGRPFAVRRHLERLQRSAAGLALPLRPADELRSAIGEVIAANGVSDGRVRLTVTGGPSPLGSERGKAGPMTLIAATAMKPWPATTDVVMVPWPRNERGALAGLKTISYGENVVALAYARERGAGEAIFGNIAGNLCEGTGTNMFVGVGGRLITPPLSSGCLAGVTRDLLLEITGAVEEDIALDRLSDVDEAFVSSSTREVQPVAHIDGRALSAAPGPLTAAAADAFAALVAREIDP
jgi:branched-chain amino acid aminotransferase